MKNKWLYVITAILFIALSVFLLIEDEERFIVITSPRIYSIYHSDELETVDIEVLTNESEHYYFDDTFISQIHIENQDQTIPFRVQQVVINENDYVYQEQIFDRVTFRLKIDLYSADLTCMLDDANLVIDYENGSQLNVSIGEFNYLFSSEENHGLALGDLSATYEPVNGINSIGGVNLNLTNRLDQPINITAIKLLSTGVIANESLITEMDACSYQSSVEDCLGIEKYSFLTTPLDDSLNDVILGGQEYRVYIPLSYVGARHISEFAMLVSYEVNNQEYTFVVDNFPFMKTANFQPDYEEWYHVYYPDNNV